MTTLQLFCAQGPPSTELTTIDISIPIPRRQSLAEQDKLFCQQARQLHRALRDSLPGGTYDRLLVEMMTYRASQFVVPLSRSEDAP